MAAFVAQPASSDEEDAISKVRGQRHDRITAGLGGDVGDDDNEIEITGVQKMLSAVSGSLLTSVLGMTRPSPPRPPPLTPTNHSTVTPLDVVRVRLQSQPSPAPTLSAPTLPATSASPSSFSKLPTNLGVTSCCREVFWVNNNADFCVASPSTISTASATTSADCAVEDLHRRNFTSTFDGLRKIARHEGLSTLWRGLSPTLVMAVPANVIYFAGYDWLRHSKRSPLASRVPDAYAPLIAGSVARISAATVISPVEMFRTRLQASSSHSSSSSPAARSLFSDTLRGLNEMVHTQGYTSLWRGLTLTLWRDVPFSGLYWWGYEAVRNVLTDAREKRQSRLSLPSSSSSSYSSSSSSTSSSSSSRTRSRSRSRSQETHSTTLTDSFIAGATSGAIAAVLTTPFDVGKTRQQVLRHAGDTVASGSSSSGGSSGEVLLSRALRPEDRSMPRFLWHIFQTEGVPGLWKGWAARCLKVAPACAIMISSYEVGKKMARGVNERKEGREEGV